MTFDGLHQYAHDAWGRMTTATHSRAGDWLRSAAQVPVPRALWGARYSDELVQVAVNTGLATDNTCVPPSRRPLRRAGVLGIADADGVLVERYEYTPYGQRTVYRKADPDDALTTAPLYYSQQVATSELTGIGHGTRRQTRRTLKRLPVAHLRGKQRAR